MIKFSVRFLVLGAVLALCMNAKAQNQPGRDSVPVKGVVTSVAANRGSFTLKDKSGNEATLVINGGTKYFLGQSEAPFIDVIVIGEKVTVDVSNYVAVGVTNKNKGSRLTSAQLKATLDVTDEECEVLVPLIAQVQLGKQLLKDDGVSGSDVRTAYDALHSAIKDKNSAPSDITFRLSALRAARAKARAALEKSTQELISLLTARQEAQLVQAGVLQ